VIRGVTPVLRTERLTLVPLDSTFVLLYDERECNAAETHWAEHGFGHWAIFDGDEFVGGAEVHYAYPGVDGIATDEIEVGWSIVESRRNEGVATEAMRAAIADVWTRAGADHVTAFIRGENPPSARVAEKLGLLPRSRTAERTVYELCAA
jgi:RimJ/RimL family protein N-acetyltransferase